MSNMNVTYAEMTDAATRLTAGKEDVQTKLTELQTMIANLVNSGFVTDSASGAFNTSYEQFTRGVTEAVGGLDGMSGFLTQAAQTLQQVDEELGKALSA